MGSNPTGGAHGYLSVVTVLCYQVDVSETGWSLVQRSPTDCGASLSVIRNLANGEPSLAHWEGGGISHQKRKNGCSVAYGCLCIRPLSVTSSETGFYIIGLAHSMSWLRDSMTGNAGFDSWNRNFCLFQDFQSSSGDYPASYSVGSVWRL